MCSSFLELCFAGPVAEWQWVGGQPWCLSSWKVSFHLCVAFVFALENSATVVFVTLLWTILLFSQFVIPSYHWYFIISLGCQQWLSLLLLLGALWISEAGDSHASPILENSWPLACKYRLFFIQRLYSENSHIWTPGSLSVLFSLSMEPLSCGLWLPVFGLTP